VRIDSTDHQASSGPHLAQVPNPKTVPLPAPPTPAQARAAATSALEILVDLTEQGHSDLHHSTLVPALAPLFMHPSLEVKCRACGRTVGAVALLPLSAQLRFASRRRGKSQRLGGIYDFAPPDWDRPHRFEPWIEDGLAGRGNAQTAGDPDHFGGGYPDRMLLTCPKCGTRSRVKNETLLRLYLQEIKLGQRALSLRHLPQGD